MSEQPRDPEALAKPLGAMVEREAKRVLTEAQLAPDPQRLADGWERRFIADARRAEEVTALYEQLGFEVAADPIRPEQLGDECDDCQLALLQFKTIYTRPRRAE
jgi:hypothetical protein